MKKTKKMKNKYGTISNLEEMEAAQKQLKKKLLRKEREVEKRFNGLRDDYSTPRLFAMTMRTARADVPLLRAIRFLKKKLSSV